MDIVYPLGNGSTWKDLELLYSLRSVHQHLPDVDRVIVVGARPVWLTNIVHVPATDPHRCKERNIADKVVKACAVADGPFLFANDDHFALVDQAATVPNWRAGPLQDLIRRLKVSSHYRQALANTDAALKAAGLPVWNYDVHLPIVYDPAEFPRIMAAYDWTKERGYTVKSLYANTAQVPPTPCADLKLSSPNTMTELVRLLTGRRWFSTSPGSLGPKLKELFGALYPTPSPWEVGGKPLP